MCDFSELHLQKICLEKYKSLEIFPMYQKCISAIFVAKFAVFFTSECSIILRTFRSSTAHIHSQNDYDDEETGADGGRHLFQRRRVLPSFLPSVE